MSASERKVIVARDPIETAAAIFSSTAIDAIGRRGRFVTALSGGSTPKRLFERLTAAPYREAIDWRKVYLLWGDERCVPPDHSESNYGMARKSLLAPLGIASANIVRMEAERADLEKAASDYEMRLRTLLLEDGSDGRIDLVLLGMGADGHTASLFPGTRALD
jgi:6-phosphogluconolactonase